MMVINKTALIAELDLMTGVGGTLNGVKVHLFNTPFDLTQDSLLAEFIEATFAGYAASAVVVWGAAFMNQNNEAETLGPSILFAATDAVTPNQVHGYYITNGAGTVWIAAEVFATPVPMVDGDSNLVLIPRYVHGTKAA